MVGNNANTKYLTSRALQYPEIDEECWKIFVKHDPRTYQLLVTCYWQRLMRLHYDTIIITLVLQMVSCQDFQQDTK